MDEKKLKQGLEEIGQITFDCGFIKLNSDKTDIIYLRIDNHIFYKDEILNGNAINFIRNMQKAKTIVREIDDIKNLDKYQTEFVLKYHPTWIAMRDEFGFNKVGNDEIHCKSNFILQTYDEWTADEFKISGYTPNTNVKDKKVPISYNTYVSTLDFNKLNQELSYEENVCSLYAAYYTVAKIKKAVEKNKNYFKNLNNGVKNISFEMGKDRFPIVKLHTKNKNKYTYDFRIPEKKKECLEILNMQVYRTPEISEKKQEATNKNRTSIFKKTKTLTLKPVIPVVKVKP